MTNKEAAEYIIKRCNPNYPNGKLEWELAINMAIDALWKALYDYEDRTEKQFMESDELDIGDWILHRISVQNMSDIDRQTILSLPSAQPTIEPRAKGHWIELPGVIGVAYCSECNYQLTENNTNFCPNCGADMREVTE